jgi:6-phosphogluconolactonase (cycloisomerase 2 family)
MLIAYVGTHFSWPGDTTSSSDAAVFTFAVDAETGQLTYVTQVQQEDPSWVMVSRKHQMLATYSPNFEGQARAAVVAYDLKPQRGVPVRVGECRIPMTHAAVLSLDRNERFMFVACTQRSQSIS